MDSEKVFDTLLFQAVQPQNVPIGPNSPVDVHADKARYIPRKPIKQTPFLKKGYVKPVSVVVDQHGKPFDKFQERLQDIPLRLTTVRKPLGQLPGALAKAGAADEIEPGIISGETGGLDVKKEQFLDRKSVV